MKILFIGDVHLGSSYHLGYEDTTSRKNTRLLDFCASLSFATDVALADDQIKYVCFLGDLFRDNRPSSELINELGKSLSKLSSHHKEVLIIPGNHDLTQSLSSYHALSIFNTLQVNGVHILDRIGCRDLTDGVSFLSLPYRNLNMLNVASHADGMEPIEKKFLSLIKEKRSVSPQKLLVAAGHFLVDGVQKFGMEISNVEKEFSLPLSMFKDVDFTFMGHVHNAQSISENPYIYFVGSLDRSDFGEEKDRKYITILDCTNRSVNHIEVPARPLKHIAIKVTNREDFFNYIKTLDLKNAIVKVTLTVDSNTISTLNEAEILSVLNDSEIRHCVGIFIIKEPSNLSAIAEETNIEDILQMVADDIIPEEVRSSVVSRATEIIRTINDPT